MNKRALYPALLLCVVVTTLAATVTTMDFKNREGRLRATPSHLGKRVADCHYGDRFEVIEERGPWVHVTRLGTDITGWLHNSVLTAKAIQLSAGETDADLAASSGELALAAKGFTQEVEDEFQARHPDISFEWVDKMEKQTVSEADITRFLTDGSLALPEGGAK